MPEIPHAGMNTRPDAAHSSAGPGRFTWDDAVRAALLAILMAAPLAFGAVQTWAWTTLLVLGLILFFVWAISATRHGALRLVWSPLYLPASAFLLIGLVQYVGHRTADAFATREALLNLTCNLVYFFLAGQLLTAKTPTNVRRWGLATATYAPLLAFFAIIQYFSSGGLIYWQVKPRWGGWVFGPYVNHNHYAGLMEMLIPVGAAYVLTRPKHHPARIPLGTAMTIPVLSLLLSGSRGGLIALLVEIQVLIVLVFRAAADSKRRRLATTLVFGLFSVLLLFFALAPGDVLHRLEGLANLSHSPDVSLGQRLQVAKDSIEILHAHPLLGTGLGSFSAVYPQYCTFPTDQHWDHAHNDYAEALAETGLVGGFLMLWALVLGLRIAFRGLRDRMTREGEWIRIGAAVGCCGLLVHGLADFNFHIPANALWFAVCLAIATSPSPAVQDEAMK